MSNDFKVIGGESAAPIVALVPSAAANVAATEQPAEALAQEPQAAPADEIGAIDPAFLQAEIRLYMNDKGIGVSVVYADGQTDQVVGWYRSVGGVTERTAGADKPEGEGWQELFIRPRQVLFQEQNLCHVLALFLQNNLSELIPTAAAQYMMMRSNLVKGMSMQRPAEEPRIITGSSEIAG